MCYERNTSTAPRFYLFFFYMPVVGWDTEVRAREVGKEPLFLGRRRKLETRFA